VRRRDFITLVGGAAAAWPIAARAQQAAMPVFGILLVFSRESGRTFTEPLRAYMQALGYIEAKFCPLVAPCFYLQTRPRTASRDPRSM
jgi:putative tryptophan/tyrosine transport system substrate-binding protein